MVQRTDDFLRPRGYYDNQGNLLKVGFDVINTLPTNFDSHLISKSPHANTPSCRAYHNAAQSVPHATSTPLALNSERFDTDTIHDVVTNNTRLTCNTAGVYVITGCAVYLANATGRRMLQIRLNGTTVIADIEITAVSGGNNTVLSITSIYSLSLNDYVELVAFQDSGGALNVSSSGNISPEFSMIRVG